MHDARQRRDFLSSGSDLIGFTSTTASPGGRRPVPVSTQILQVGVAFNVDLCPSLEASAMILGAIWVAIGLAYLAWMTRLFTKQPPELTNAQPGKVEQ